MSLAAGTIALPLIVAVFDCLFKNVDLDSYGHSCGVIMYIERLFASLYLELSPCDGLTIV
jgi:hypothetical protein